MGDGLDDPAIPRANSFIQHEYRGAIHGCDPIAIVTITGYYGNQREIFRNPDCKGEVLLDTFRRGIAEAAYMVIGFARLNEALTFSTERSPFQGDAEFPGHFMTHNDRRRTQAKGA